MVPPEIKRKSEGKGRPTQTEDTDDPSSIVSSIFVISLMFWWEKKNNFLPLLNELLKKTHSPNPVMSKSDMG